MEKKFKDYYKTGIKNSYKTLFKRKSNFVRYYICFFIYILCIPLLILKPVINMATFRLGNQINEDNDIELTSLTKSCDNPKNYFTVLFAGLMKILIITGAILIICVAAGVLAGMGYIIMNFTERTDYTIVLLFASPALLVILLYIIFVPILYAEIGYIVDANNDINASNALNLSFNAYKHEGKRIKFLILLVNLLILIGCLAIFGVVTALPILINGYSTVNLGITLLILVAVLVPFAILSPIFVLGTISSITLLNDDVVKDTLTDVVSATNVKFHLPKKDIEDLTTEEKLAYLFDKADGLKPDIKDLRILDSLDIVGEEDASDSDVVVEKKVEKETEKPITIDIIEEKQTEDVVESKEASQVLTNNFIEEKPEENEESSWSDEESNKDKQQDFEAITIKEVKDENITDNIVMDVYSEKVSEEVVENLDGKVEAESEDFEAMKDTNSEELTETIKEDIKDEDPITDEENTEENIPTDDVIEEIPQEEIIEEAKEESTEEETWSDEASWSDEEETVEEEKEENVEEPVEEAPIEETKETEEVQEEITEEPKEETNEVVDPVVEGKETTEEEVLDEVEDLLKPKEEKQEEEFDMDLFNDKSSEGNDEEINLDDFFKKGDE